MPIVPPQIQYIQQEAVNGVNPNSPVPESLLFAMAGSVNAILQRILPVGSILPTMLTEVQFQAQIGNPNPHTWILADGRSFGIAGSTYAQITGNNFIPNLNGVFIRGKDNGSSINPDGDLPLGAYQADAFASHNHNWHDPGHVHNFVNAVRINPIIYQSGSSLSAWDLTGGSTSEGIAAAGTGITVNASGGNESRPRNVTINWMIRIN